jgi:hypothetical protein
VPNGASSSCWSLPGATVDQPDRGGVTPLHRAVRARSPAAVAALLSAGADPHVATGKAGSTPLHLAVAPTGASGTAGAGDLQLEIVRMLLAAGATMADVDRNGVAVADRIQSQALRDALAAGQLLSPGLANVSRVRHDVADHGVRVAALRVKVGVGVILGDAPQAVLLVPIGRPLRVVRE